MFASDALSAVGRQWRIAFESESLAGVKSAVRFGLAVSVLPQSLMESSNTVTRFDYKTRFYSRLPITVG